MLGARGQDDGTTSKNSVKTHVMRLRDAVMLVVEFVGEDFVKRAKLEKWATVDTMLSDFDGWGEE